MCCNQVLRVSPPDPAAEAEPKPALRGDEDRARTHGRGGRLCRDAGSRGRPRSSFPALFMRRADFFGGHSFALLPAREPPSVPLQPRRGHLKVHSPHLARPGSGPDHLLQPQRRPDRRKQNHTIKGINRRGLPAALGPPPGLPLPGRSPRNTPPHGLWRAAEASRSVPQPAHWACAIDLSRLRALHPSERGGAREGPDRAAMGVAG